MPHNHFNSLNPLTSPDADPRLSRRSFLKAGSALAAAALAAPVLSRLVRAADESGSSHADDPYGGLKMGIQSYTLREDSFDKMLDAMKDELHLHYVELFGQHLTGISPRQALEKLKTADVNAISYGVVGFSKDHEANRKVFEMAKAMGYTNLSCDPTPDAFDSLDKLTDEYNITAAIHDHGPGHRWGKIDVIHEAIKDHNKKIGLCCDTGHFIRAGEDPMRALEVFKDRLYAVHLKDFKKEGKDWEDVPAGDANLKVDQVVDYLLHNKFTGGLFIEFEGQKPGDHEYPVRASQTSAARVRDAVKKHKAG